MTFPELEKWAEEHGAKIITHFRPCTWGRGWWADAVWTEEVNGRKTKWGIGAAGPYNSEDAAKRALCRATAKILESKR